MLLKAENKNSVGFLSDRKTQSTLLMILAGLTFNIAQSGMRISSLENTHFLSAPTSVSIIKYSGILFIMILITSFSSYKNHIIGKGGSSTKYLNKDVLPSLIIWGVSDSLASILLLISGMKVPLMLNSVLGDLHIMLTPIVFFVFRISSIDKKMIFAFLLSFMGIILFALDDFNNKGKVDFYVLLPILAASMWSLAATQSKKLEGIPNSYVQMSIAFFGIVFISFFFYFNEKIIPQTSFIFNPFMMMVLFFSILSQVCFVVSMTRGDVLSAIIAAPSYAIFGGIIGWFFFDEKLGILNWFGLLLVMGGIITYYAITTTKKSNF